MENKPFQAIAAIKFILSVVAILMSLELPATAQITRGSLSGNVTDPTGALLPNAEVILKNPANGAEVKTISNAEGEFVLPSLAIGNYELMVEAKGFKRFVIQSVIIEVATPARVSVVLSLGEISEIVTVSNVQELVNTTAPTLNNIVERRQIVDLPLSSRNPIELVRLQAGVTGSGANASNAAGLRGATTNITRDGINVMDNYIKTSNFNALTSPTVEATGEFSVSVGTVSSDAGRGVVQVRVVTPSGTNQYHGGLFWYHRNSVLNANTFMNNSTNTARPFSLQNRVGFIANGPVHLPKKLFGPLSYDGRNRSFWFLSYEAFRQPLTLIRTRTVLTPEARTGNFRYVGANGQTQSISLYNIGINKTENPIVKSLIDQTPLPNNSLVGDGLNLAGYNFGAKGISIIDRWSSRFDQVLTEKSRIGAHRLEFVFHRTPSTLTPDTGTSDAPFPGGVNSTQTAEATATAAAIHSTFGLHVANEVRFGHQRTPIFLGPEKAPTVPFFLNLQLITNPFNSLMYNTRNTTVYHWQDHLSWVKSTHTIRFGAETQSITYHNFSDTSTIPAVNLGVNPVNPDGILNTIFPSLPAGATGQTIANRARSLYAILTGNLATATQTFNVTSPTSGFVPRAGSQYPIRQRELNLYASDQWRAQRNLTINAGVRWEWLGVPKMLNGLVLLPVNGIAGLFGISGEGNLFQPGVLKGTAPTLLDFAGEDKGRPFYNNDWNNFAPYFGFAFSPSSEKGWRNKLFGGEGKSSIRGGYSISYMRDGLSVHRRALVGNPGLTSTVTNTAPTGVLTAAGVPIAVPAFKTPITDLENFQRNPVASFLVSYDPKLRTPYVQQWSFGIERQLPGKIAVEARYVGNHAVKLYRAFDINELNIYENGFLQEFLNAQKNLAINNGISFAPGAAGTVPLPIFAALFTGLPAASGFANTAFINNLNQNNVGTLGVTLASNATYATNRTRLAPNFFRANQNASNAILITNGAFSNYHSLQLEARRRFSNGLSFQADYTFGKAITDNEGSPDNFEPHRTIRNLRLNRHRADFDIAHTFISNFIYELPVGPGRRFANDGPALWRKVVEGWQTQGIISWHSGLPVFATSGRTTVNNQVYANPAQLLGINFANFKQQVSVYKTSAGVFFVNPDLINITTNANGTLQVATLKDGILSSPAPGQFGNFPRNAINAPSFFQADFGLLKRTRITEHANVEFRMEFFNLFNTVNFGAGSLAFDNTRFGQITDTFNARFGQIALRINF